jgi:hypothetical protein
VVLRAGRAQRGAGRRPQQRPLASAGDGAAAQRKGRDPGNRAPQPQPPVSPQVWQA